MEPLDLTARPPRSCRATLDGLVLLPRTIDKLRAFLPGGNPGPYLINAPTMLGLSGYLLIRLGIEEDDLRRIVAEAADEHEVAAWVRAHSDPAAYDEINGAITHLRPRHARDQEFFLANHGETMRAHPELEFLVDILDADDRRMFPEVAS